MAEATATPPTHMNEQQQHDEKQKTASPARPYFLDPVRFYLQKFAIYETKAVRTPTNKPSPPLPLQQRTSNKYFALLYFWFFFFFCFVSACEWQRWYVIGSNSAKTRYRVMKVQCLICGSAKAILTS
jgi:hypothetical protein